MRRDFRRIYNLNKFHLMGFLAILIIGSLIVAGIILVDLAENKEAIDKLNFFPISVGQNSYMISVRSNYSSVPEVSYWGLGKSVSVDFRGDRENAFCNITIPSDLIWGELSVYDKVYKMSEADYVISSNSTHNAIYFLFNHTALVKHFEIRGTEGVME